MRRGEISTQGSVAALRVTAGLQIEAELRLPSPAFAASLERRGVTISEQEGNRYRIRLPEETTDPGRVVLEAARESGAQLRGFRPAVRSLEDVFLEAVE